MLQQRSSAASNMQKQSACAGHWQQQHHCQLCATTLAVETQKELVRLQLPARHVQAAAAATAVWLARRLTGSDTKVRAGTWLLLVWHVYKSQPETCCHSIRDALLVHVIVGEVCEGRDFLSP
jgi:hypothetical protein